MKKSDIVEKIINKKICNNENVNKDKNDKVKQILITSIDSKLLNCNKNPEDSE